MNTKTGHAIRRARSFLCEPFSPMPAAGSYLSKTIFIARVSPAASSRQK